MATFHLTIARVGENLFDGEALSITLPGVEGEFTVLARHESFVSELKKGDIYVQDAGNERHHFPAPQGGVAEVSYNQTTILL